MKIFSIERGSLRWAPWLAVLGLAACVQNFTTEDDPRVVTFSREPFPHELARYEAPLFDLVRSDGKTFDAQLARQLRALLASQLRTDTRYIERLTSGPAPDAAYYVTGRRGYVYFTACQAHACDDTSLDVLFDATDYRLVGKLQEKGAVRWLGRPDQREMVLIDHLVRTAR